MSSSSRGSAFAGLLTLCLVASLLVVGPASADRRLHRWLAASDELVAAVDANPDKIPVEFEERLDYELADGTMRVLVALSERDAAIEDFVGTNTVWVQWYGDAPRFLGRVTQVQMAALLDADFITFVEPDYPITNFMSSSTIDVHARSLAADGTGVWSYSPGPNGGSLVSDVPGLTVDQATGKGVTVAITDSGIDKTHRDFGGFNCAAGPYQPCESRIRAAISIDHIVGAGVEPGPAMPTTELASGHGTHVAGTVAGNSYYTRFDPTPDTTTYAPDGHNFGIAPQASLVSTKNGDSQSAGFSTFGLQWQLDNAEQLGIRVSSNSWGCLGGCSFNGNSAMAQLLRDMYGAGIVVVFAAGNDGAGSDGLSNAQSPYTLGVANYDDTNHRLASSSSRGTDNTLPTPSAWTPESEPVNGEPRPDVGAPGTAIWSARTLTGGTSSGVPRVALSDVAGGSNSGVREYAQLTGTSMSTPHVAGTAALMFSACPTATPLDVMRAIMAGADPTEILKTSGTQTAQPSEIGYGSLEIRQSLDWLMNEPVCGGSGNTDPTPTTSPEPTQDPTQPPTPQEATKFYLHSGSGLGNVDFATGEATFDTTAPTETAPASWYDNGLLVNDGAFDPAFTGTIDKQIHGFEIDIWQWSPVARIQGRLDYEAAIQVGDTIYRLPPAEQETDAVITNEVTRFTARWTTMLEGGAEVPMSIDPGTEPVTIFIRGSYLDVETVTELVYDSVDFASSFTVFTNGTASPSPTPTPDPAVATTLTMEGSATGVQHSDKALIQATLTNAATGEPISGQEILFEITDEGSVTHPLGTRPTDENGVAADHFSFDEAPGSYVLTATFAESDGYGFSHTGMAFAITQDDSATTLEIVDDRQVREMRATVVDSDNSEGLKGVTVVFLADDEELGSAPTNDNGVAVLRVGRNELRNNMMAEAVFEGSEGYEGSSAHQRV
ncbi:MAG: S8 family peptidase [Actinomycetota bacterium]